MGGMGGDRVAHGDGGHCGAPAAGPGKVVGMLAVAGNRVARLAVVLVALAPWACGTPPRRLPARVVDDPITLPRRMMEVAVSTSGTLRDRHNRRNGNVYPAINYGLTDRLELVEFLALRYALLDDAPPASAATGIRSGGAPLALAVEGGLAGLGFSSAEALIVFPQVGLSLSKGLSDRIRVGGRTGARAAVSSRRHETTWRASTYVLVQTTERLALDVDLGVWSAFSGLTPSSRWKEREVWLGPGLAYRPWHWFTLGLDLNIIWGFERMQRIELTPDMPLPGPPPNRPELWGLLTTTFTW
jgi:hypothetical protein